jgi:hypothetical protein
MPTATTLATRSPGHVATPQEQDVTLTIGAIAIALRTRDPGFRQLLEDRYVGFLTPVAQPDFLFDVKIASPSLRAPDDDLRVKREGGCWSVERGDFSASWDHETRCGWIRQSASPYSADTLLRIVHSIALAEKGGFLLHAASAVRNGRAFLFSGVSGTGKTTLTRLAPPDVHILTDEISYVIKEADGYHAYGTPFAGELARVGENISAPIAGLYFLEQAPRNRLVASNPASALRSLLRNILFLANDKGLVQRVFHTAAEFVFTVPVHRMQFTPQSAAWKMIV